jgi:ergothioneine biosynthesis protein EgtB
MNLTGELHGVAHPDLAAHCRSVRRRTEALCKPLVIEDFVVQSMPDASPVKWHLAHTTWFIETTVLSEYLADYRPFNSEYGYLFNSYYETWGARACRSKRGSYSRPTVEEVYKYREYVDAYLMHFIESGDALSLAAEAAVELALHHEEQHQELLVTDVKSLFAANPLRPQYRGMEYDPADDIPPMRWHEYAEGIYTMGHDGEGFAYDNESPEHKTYLNSFRLASRLVTNREYLSFIEEGGYQRADGWLSDGWTAVQNGGWTAPLYWENIGGKWWTMTLAGMREVEKNEPVCHVSYFEAEAFARWWGHRLPTEAEWESAARLCEIEGNFADSGRFHPAPVRDLSYRQENPTQLFGDVWEWTQSAYLPYPGYRRDQGAAGEYNGKFMNGQMTLRGGSCATPKNHIRATYRNYLNPAARWQFSGIRLAEDS